MECTLQSVAVFHTVLRTGNRTPTPATPYIHSVISVNKSGALEAMGGSMKGRKESCSWSLLNRGLSHLERPVYSPSIMALIFWSLLSNSIHPHTQRLTLSPITHATTFLSPKGPQVSVSNDVEWCASFPLNPSVLNPDYLTMKTSTKIFSKSQKYAKGKMIYTLKENHSALLICQ